MTSPRPPELFASERPVRSDYARERAYARRRFMTVVVLLLALGGGAYALWGRGPANPADIPTIKAEGAYKQKPADPGGIDIPHQDVRVYDQLESKNPPAAPVEHLLPPPEIPQDVPQHVDAASVAAQQTAPQPVPQPAPPSPAVAAPADPLLEPAPAKQVQTTIAPAPAPVAPVARPAKPQPQSLSIEQIIERTKAADTTPLAAPAASPVASGTVVIQLASVPDQAKAQDMMQKLQQKYATQLGAVTLRLARADLGSRGVYYRIQSAGIGEGDANHICSALKQMNAGCIIVRR